MSESKLPCPFCERPIGGVHTRACSRSALRMHDRARGGKLLRRFARQRIIWRSAVLATREEVETEDGGLRSGVRPAVYRSKRRGDRAHAIVARDRRTARIVPLYRVLDKGMYVKPRTERRA